MLTEETTAIEWDKYAIKCIVRSFSVSLAISFVFVLLAAIIPGPAWWVIILGSGVIALSSLFVLFWTVAEMVEHGLDDANGAALSN